MNLEVVVNEMEAEAEQPNVVIGVESVDKSPIPSLEP